jgi:hypothetical protein
MKTISTVILLAGSIATYADTPTVVMLLFENQGQFTIVGRLLNFANGRFRVAKN